MDSKKDIPKNEYKKARQRSPKYPAFSIDEAIQKVKTLWQTDGKPGAPTDVALRHLGYNSPASGPALRAISTLKNFGLTAEKDKRMILSETALDLVTYSNDDQRYLIALKNAFLKPNIYNELYSKYKDGFPSDDALKAELIRVYEFNPAKVERLLLNFKRSLDFAKPALSTIENDDQENVMESENISNREATSKKGALWDLGSTYNKSHREGTPAQGLSNMFPILLKNQNKATIAFGRLPVEKADIELIKNWINLMQENLTEKTPADSNQEGS